MADQVNIIERLLDRVDKMAEDVVHVREGLNGVNSRLDKINGSVGRHEEQLRSMDTWKVTTDHNITGLKEDTKDSKLTNATMLKIAALVSLTILGLGKVSGPVVDQVLALLK